jgi:hypothetical protein
VIEQRQLGWALALGIAIVLAPMHGIAAAPSSVQDGPVAVSPLTIRGDMPRQSARRLEQRLLDGMTDAGFEVVGPDAIVRMNASATKCIDAACIEAVARATGTTAVLRTTVRVEQRDYTITGELIAADGTRVLVRAEDECDLCGVEEAGDRLAALAVSIRRKLDADARARPQLNVTTVPAGAKVFVDGEVVGTSPLELALAPGTHDVRVAKDGFAPRKREVELVQGVDASMTIELSPVADPVARHVTPERRGAPAWIGWSVLGGGAVSTIVGVTLLALHTQPIRRKCTGANVDMDGTCRFNHNTLVPGAVLGAAGLTLLSTGIALVVTRRRRVAASAKIDVSPSPGGVAVRF